MKPATLQTIFDVFIKTRDKLGPNTQPPASASSATSQSNPSLPPAADKAQAEKHKQMGNAHMSSKNYDEAIESYNKAITLDTTNAVYYSNRAAAHSSKGDHLSAIGDAEQAISVDPQFIKGYHRLGYRINCCGDDLPSEYHSASDTHNILSESSVLPQTLLKEDSS